MDDIISNNNNVFSRLMCPISKETLDEHILNKYLTDKITPIRNGSNIKLGKELIKSKNSHYY